MIVEVFIRQNNSCVSALELCRETWNSCVTERSPKFSPSFALGDLMNVIINSCYNWSVLQWISLPRQSLQDSELLFLKATDPRACD